MGDGSGRRLDIVTETLDGEGTLHRLRGLDLQTH